MTPQERFDNGEADRLVNEARAVEDEFADLGARDREEYERLARLCSRRALLWSNIAAALDSGDTSGVRASAEAVRQSARDAFLRSWRSERGDAQRSA